MKKFWKVFDCIMEDLLFVSVAGCTIICFLQVIFRYILNNSLSWSEELCRYLFVLMVFVGTGIGVLQKKHMAIDLIVNKFSKKSVKFINLIISIIMAIYGVTFTYYSINLSFMNFQQFSPALRIPLGIIYLLLPLGGILIVINSIRVGVSDFLEVENVNNNNC